MKKIIGNTVGTTRPKANLLQNDPAKGDFVKGKEKFLEQASSGVDFKTNDTLILEDGILSVNTTNLMEQDNTLPITSAGVYAAVGNIEALLKTI